MPRIPTVEITFNSEKHWLTFDYNAIAELKALADAGKLSGMADFRDTVWAGLLAETLDDNLRPIPGAHQFTRREVGDILLIMDEADVKALGNAIMLARETVTPPAEGRPTPAAE